MTLEITIFGTLLGPPFGPLLEVLCGGPNR